MAARVKSQAARVCGSDCDFTNGRISIKGAPETGTKNWEIRTIPMIPDMRRLLERVRSHRENDSEWLQQPVMRVRECHDKSKSEINQESFLTMKRTIHVAVLSVNFGRAIRRKLFKHRMLGPRTRRRSRHRSTRTRRDSAHSHCKGRNRNFCGNVNCQCQRRWEERSS